MCTQRGLLTSVLHVELLLVWLHGIDSRHKRSIVTVDARVEGGDKTESIKLEHPLGERPDIAPGDRICKCDVVDIDELLVADVLVDGRHIDIALVLNRC